VKFVRLLVLNFRLNNKQIRLSGKSKQEIIINKLMKFC